MSREELMVAYHLGRRDASIHKKPRNLDEIIEAVVVSGYGPLGGANQPREEVV